MLSEIPKKPCIPLPNNKNNNVRWKHVWEEHVVNNIEDLCLWEIVSEPVQVARRWKCLVNYCVWKVFTNVFFRSSVEEFFCEIRASNKTILERCPWGHCHPLTNYYTNETLSVADQTYTRHPQSRFVKLSRINWRRRADWHATDLPLMCCCLYQPYQTTHPCRVRGEKLMQLNIHCCS